MTIHSSGAPAHRSCESKLCCLPQLGMVPMLRQRMRASNATACANTGQSPGATKPLPSGPGLRVITRISTKPMPRPWILLVPSRLCGSPGTRTPNLRIKSQDSDPNSDDAVSLPLSLATAAGRAALRLPAPHTQHSQHSRMNMCLARLAALSQSADAVDELLGVDRC